MFRNALTVSHGHFVDSAVKVKRIVRQIAFQI